MARRPNGIPRLQVSFDLENRAARIALLPAINKQVKIFKYDGPNERGRTLGF